MRAKSGWLTEEPCVHQAQDGEGGGGESTKPGPKLAERGPPGRSGGPATAPLHSRPGQRPPARRGAVAGRGGREPGRDGRRARSAASREPHHRGAAQAERKRQLRPSSGCAPRRVPCGSRDRHGLRWCFRTWPGAAPRRSRRAPAIPRMAAATTFPSAATAGKARRCAPHPTTGAPG